MSTTPPAYKYFAFISYSRKDSRAAKWLQRRLEWFRFPVKLVPANRRPAHPVYLRDVYRDKTNLEVDHEHYWKNIQKAVEQSRFLIVLCSPHAAASGPVDREVRHFIASSSDAVEFVVPVLLSGNVGSGDNEECLCPSLRELGSVLTDRNLPTMVPDADDSEAEGWENGFIGVAAYLLNLRRQDLLDHVRREERRKALKARALAGAFAVLGMVAAAAGVAAWFKQREAERQRNQAVHNLGLAHAMRDEAQELNLFFIVNLRQKLRALGRLDLLAEATDRVVAYHERIPPELANEPGMLRSRAMAMDYSGQIAMSQGQADEAVKRLRVSHAAWCQILEAEGEPAEALQGFVVSCRMLGEALQSAGDDSAALAVYQEGVRALGKLQGKGDEGVVLLKRLCSMLLGSRGQASYRLGDHAGALRDLDEAAALAKEAVEARPEDRACWQQVTEAFLDLAAHYARIDDHKAALKQAQAGVEAAQTLAELDIEHADGWRFLALSHGTLMSAHAALKNWSDATDAAEKQLSWSQRILLRDPQNPAAEAEVAEAHDDLGFTLTYLAEDEKAVNHFSKAVQLYAGLIQRFPTHIAWRRDLALVFKRRADLCYENEAWELALEDYDNALRMISPLTESRPEDVDARSRLANLLIAKGETQWKMGQTAAAEKTFEEGLAALRKAPAPPADHPEIASRERSLRKALDALHHEMAAGTPKK